MYNTDKINDDSYDDIAYIYSESGYPEITSEYLAEKFATQSFGLKNIGVIAKDEKKEPAAYYGVFPIVMTYDSKDVIIAQSGNTITGPNHRKKGLFTRLAKETYLLSKEFGIKLVYGFPNQNSYPGFKRKLDWVFTGFMQRFIFKVKAIPLAEIATKFSFLSSTYFKYYKFRLARFKIDLSQEDFSDFNYTKERGLIKKDKVFFDYKLKNKDLSLINYKGYKFLIKVRTFLFIGDVGFKQDFEAKSFMKTVESLAKKIGCRQVYFSLSANHWLYEYLKQSGNPEDTLPIGYYVIDNSIDIEKIQFIYCDLDTY